MCLEECFERYCWECPEPCWPRDDLLPMVSPQTVGVSSHSTKFFLSTYNHSGIDPQPVGELQAISSNLRKPETDLQTRLDYFQPVEKQNPDQHEKQARRVKDMATIPGEMPGSSPQFQYEKRWYVVGD
jgi:hypothetical protein